jgi:hypothetical protein
VDPPHHESTAGPVGVERREPRGAAGDEASKLDAVSEAKRAGKLDAVSEANRAGKLDAVSEPKRAGKLDAVSEANRSSATRRR